VVRRWGRALHVSEARLDQSHEFFARHGATAVLVGRFIAILRSYIGIFAGVARMDAARFTIANVAGGVLWVCSFSTLGYLFGRNLPRLIHYVGRVSLLIALLIALVAAVIMFWRWFRANETRLALSRDLRWARLGGEEQAGGPQTYPRGLRAAQERYLAVHLSLGMVAALASIGLFAAITESVMTHSPLTRFDIIVDERLHGTTSAAALRALAVVSALGSREAMAILFIIGIVFLASRRHPPSVIGWCAAFLGAALLDACLRFAVRRSALPFVDDVIAGWTPGVMSEHLLGALVGYGMLAYLLIGLARRGLTRMAITLAAVALVAAIAVSRLYLGIHYVSDESAGLAAGLLWLAACVSGLELVKRPASRTPVAR
jgi:undecaprenyl-diphosphatase